MRRHDEAIAYQRIRTIAISDCKKVVGARRLHRQHVNARAGDIALAERFHERGDVDDRAARRVDQDRVAFHLLERCRVDHVTRFVGEWAMEAHDIGRRQKIVEAIDAMDADISADGFGEEGDRRFHEAVTQAARSPLLADFMASLAVPISETRRSSLGEPGRPPRSLNAHRRILEAIRRGDVPGARNAMRRHVNMVADIGLLRWSAAGRDREASPVRTVTSWQRRSRNGW